MFKIVKTETYKRLISDLRASGRQRNELARALEKKIEEVDSLSDQMETLRENNERLAAKLKRLRG